MKKIYLLFLSLLPLITLAQSIESISPSSATQVESIVLSIVSKNTSFNSEVNTVKLVNSTYKYIIVNATSVVIVNDTTLNASFTFNSMNTIGLYDLVVQNAQTSISVVLEKAFTVNAPVIKIPPVLISSFPSTAIQTDTVEITVKSKHTHFAQPFPTSVSLGNANHSISSFSETVIDDETIKAKFAFNYFDEPGDYDIGISNFMDGYISLKQAFTLNPGPFPPSLISVSPSTGNRLGSTWVTIKGKNTFFKRDSCTVNLFRTFMFYVPAEKINYLDDTTMTAFFNFKDGQLLGQYDIMVANSLQTEWLFLRDAFTVQDTVIPPTLISYSPNFAKQGDSLKITVKGSNTHFFSSWCYASLRTAEAVAMGVIPSVIKVVNDSVLEGTFFFDYYTNKSSKYLLEVTDQIDGTLVATDSFTLNAGNDPPRLISVNPANATQGQKVDLLVKANKTTRFSKTVPYIRLNNNKNALYPQTHSIINDSTVLATFVLNTDSAQTGLYDVNTSWPVSSDNLSLPGSFTINKNPAPASLVSISPSAATQFDTVSMTIKASRSHFLSESFTMRMIGADSLKYNIYVNSLTAINDTLLNAKFVLNYNYYPSSLYDIEINTSLDGKMELKKAFTLNRIYDKEPTIKFISPKEALLGQSITIDITGAGKTFLPGTNTVTLTHMYNTSSSILATAVNYVNDSLIKASFSFSALNKEGPYYLFVRNKSTLAYYNFILKPGLLTSKLLTVEPPWASKADTAALVIKGFNTHFGSTDSIWLENKFGIKIKPFLLNVTNDTMTTAKFAFSKSDLPVVYSVHVKNGITENTLVLNNGFTLTGSLNAYSLMDVNPRHMMCYVNFENKIKVYGLHTHFMTDVDSMLIVGGYNQKVIYPKRMEILNDSIISAVFILDNNCGPFDILVLGKENCILVGKLIASPPVSVDDAQTQPFKIFPNPSEGVFTLELNEDFEQADVIVVDVLGKTVFSGKKLEASTQIDLSDYPAGMYFIKLVKDNLCKTEKIIKQ